MPGDFTYFRKFAILKDDYTNIASVNPKGHVKIEVKGNKGVLRLNLENCEIEEQYIVYFLAEKNGEVKELEVGKIFTDERGRGKADIAISLKDLELKGFPIDKVDGIIIRRDNNILLSGYINKNSQVLEKYMESISANEAETDELEVYEKPKESHFPVGFFPVGLPVEQNEEAVEEKSEEEMEKVEEKVDESEEKVEADIIEEKEENVEVEIEEEKQVQEANQLEKEEFKGQEKIDEDILDYQEDDQNATGYQFHDAYRVENSTYEQTYEQIEYIRRLEHKNQMTNYILSVLKYFPQVQPFKIYLHGYSWWRIDDDGNNSYRGFLPYYNYLLSADYKYPFLYNATTCLEQIRKYGHYLFGIYFEGNQAKYYVYAIPGKFTIEEHPFKGITGFNTWYDSVDGIGYWILYIDPLTGKVIYPINPMIPKD
jgi:hypothetical protein